MERQKLTIIVIGRNEERGIAACVTAAQAAAAQVGGAEIIYVDSVSTDDTVKIVRSLGARVVSLKPDWELSPSAGRYVGSKLAAGEFVLFLDADTLVYRDFLPAAIEYFEQNPDVGGVNGWLDDTDANGVKLSGVEPHYPTPTPTKWLRGPACFYRRSALLAVGSFNPFLKVEEEAELGLRLIKAGWKMDLIPVPMAVHTRCYHLQTFDSLMDEMRRNARAGRSGTVTNTIAYAFRAGNGLAFFKLRYKTLIAYCVWLLLLPIPLLLLPAFLHPKAVFAAVLLLGLAAILLKKRSALGVWVFIVTQPLKLMDILLGLRRVKIKNVGSYPLDVIEM